MSILLYVNIDLLSLVLLLSTVFILGFFISLSILRRKLKNRSRGAITVYSIFGGFFIGLLILILLITGIMLAAQLHLFDWVKLGLLKGEIQSQFSLHPRCKLGQLLREIRLAIG